MRKRAATLLTSVVSSVVFSCYQRLLVAVDAEWRDAMDARERRSCELQVELDEWKELTESERQAAAQLRSALADEQKRNEQLQLSIRQRDTQLDESVPVEEDSTLPLGYS
jgi:hypothetical protein